MMYNPDMTADQEASIVADVKRAADAWEAIATSMAQIAEALSTGARNVGKPPPSPPIQAVAPNARLSA